MVIHDTLVTPFVGVWIETISSLLIPQAVTVTPFVGVWIETDKTIIYNLLCSSHPSWVCGLKLKDWQGSCPHTEVTPFVGVWIETRYNLTCIIDNTVTPFVGVWIETTITPIS